MSPTIRPEPAKFRLPNLLAYATLGIAVALAVSWIAVRLQEQGFAPLGLFSLLVGTVLGLAFAGILHWTHAAHRSSALAATIALGVVTTFAQHVHFYIDYRRAYHAAGSSQPEWTSVLVRNPQMGPPGFSSYLRARASPSNVGIWFVDALLTWSASGILITMALRRPFCNACRTWYRETRNGVVEPQTAHRLASLCHVNRPENAESTRFRMSTCPAECGPARIQLSWICGGRTVRATPCWVAGEDQEKVIEIVERHAATRKR